MAKLTGQSIASSYDQLLIVTGADGITSSLQAVESADTGGSSSALQISTTAVKVAGTLDITTSPLSFDGAATIDTSGNNLLILDGGTAGTQLDNIAGIGTAPVSGLNLIVGAAAPTDAIIRTEGILSVSTGAQGEGLTLYQSSADTVGAKLLFIKNRNASPTTKTIVNDDDVLGRIVFGGYDNSDMNSAGAEIRAEVDGTPGTNDLPGRLIFLVTPDGNKDPVTALTIVNDGTLISLPTYSKDVGATTRDLLVDNAGLIGYQASSIRFKENVTSIQDISPIYDLDVVEFDYKKGGHSYGLIAEEVEKVMPLLVSYELEFMADGVDDEGADIMVPDYSYPNKIPESVNYSRLIPFLLKSVQELSAKVEALESK